MSGNADDGSILDKIQRESGIPLPSWVIGILSILILIGLVVAALKPLWPGIASAAKMLGAWIGRRKQDQRRAERRGLFADYVEGQIRRLGEKEEWRDNRYAELEAEVEVRDESMRQGLFRRRKAGIRRLPSLSEALEAIPHRLVLLEGDPGSGKSVALRHLTQLMCLRLVRRPSERDPIPLYVNLKEFRPAGPDVSAADVREFVLASVNRGRNRDIDRFMADEFDKGVQDGTWLFLFDSFDEIPAILSATEANETIERYSDALFNFLHGLGGCRGIVASREFRGPPRRYNWPKFTIVPLTWSRKIELIKKADLGAVVEQALIDDLQEASAELRSISDNPMFLGLLCEHMREGNTFPATAHIVTESYVSERFSRDADRIRDICGVEPELVRDIAEELAFRIASERALGLTVERRVAVPLLCAHLGLSEDEVEAGLDALEYTKLARSSDDAGSAEPTSITFSHRRIQEYFATQVVLRDATRVNTEALVLDGRWRETAVTVLQVQDEARVQDVLAVVADNLIVPGDDAFSWQALQFHLLAILADGGGYAKYADGQELSGKVDRILTAAWESGSRRNQKWTLEVCSAATPTLALRFIREAFEGDSAWLREEAYTQARRVRQITTEIEREVRQTLLDFSVSGQLWRSHRSIRAQVSRLTNPTDLLHAITLLRLVPVVDAITLAVAVVTTFAYMGMAGLLLVVFLPVIWFLPRSMFARPEENRSRWRRASRWLFGSWQTPSVRQRARQKKRVVVLASMFALYRAFPLLALALPAYLVGADFLTIVGVGLLAMLEGIWSVGALVAARDGEWLHPGRWLLLFVLPFVRAWHAVRNLTASVIREILVGVLINTVVIGGFGLLIFFLGKLFDFGSETVIKIAFGFGVVMGLGFLVTLGAVRVAAYKDRRRAEVDGLASEVSGAWLADKLSTLRLSDGIVMLLRNLQAITPKPQWCGDAVQLLGAISRQAELHKSGDVNDRERALEAFGELWEPYGIDAYPGLAKFANSQVLDEIGKVEDESHVMH